MRKWWGAVAVLVAVRVAIPVAAYAAAGSKLPGMPRFVRSPADGGLQGDATGFYQGAREFMAAWGRMPHAVLAADAVFVLAVAAVLVVGWRRRPSLRPWLVPAGVLTAAVAIAVDIHWMRPTGAAVIGWPLVWSVPMFPLRALGVLDPAVAWDAGTALSICFGGLTVIAVAFLGRNATRSARLGLLAAAFWAVWPLLVGVVAGHGAWANDQWFVGIGLHAYDEPLSTLLVTAGAAALLSPRRTRTQLALGGCLLSVATAVKLSNGLAAALALVLVYLRGREREALPFLAGAASFAPVVLVYWPISYPTLFANRRSWPQDPFNLSYVVSSWTHSYVFTPRTLAIITPLAVLGMLAMRGTWRRVFIVAFLLVNPIFYSFYANTAEHPRFLAASMPELFTLWAAGVGMLLWLPKVLVGLHVEPHREQREL